MRHISRIGLSFLACLMFVTLVGCAHDDPAKQLTGLKPGTGFLLRESKGAAGSKKYSVFIPRDYNPAVKYPAIVFLHGVGEQGGDGIGCRTVGIGPEIGRRNGNFPFIVVFPQTGGDWCNDQSDKIMMDALNDVKKNFSVDEDRVALTGMSSGGKGTWVLGARHPEVFSCLVPMGGFKAEGEVNRLTKYPIWALHNDGDFIVGSGDTKDMISKLQAAGGRPKATIYPTGGHNCWDAAYSEGELFQWMMAQRRGGAAAPTIRTQPAANATPTNANPWVKQMGSN
jgi:predicted peptidase